MKPKTICEIGCGTGDNLLYIGNEFVLSQLFGFDISPQLAPFWRENIKNNSLKNRLKFYLGDFHSLNKKKI